MATSQGYGKTVTSGSIFAYDVGDTRNSFKGEPTTNVATGTLYPYTPYNTMTRDGQNLTFTMVGNSALYLTVHNGTNYNGQIITLSGYMFKNGVPYALPYPRANTYHTVAAIEWHFDNVTGYFEIVENCNASSVWLFHTPSGASGGDVITIKDFQVEVKSHATPFVNGTRSTTQGLIDLTGNSSIDLANVSFDSNAQIAFDGTNDNIAGGASANYLPLPTHSLEACIKSPGLGSGMGTGAIFGITYGLTVQIASNGSLSYHAYNTDNGSSVALFAISSTGVNLFDDNWHHIVCTRDASNVNIYIDGVLNTTASNGGTWTGTNIWASMNMLIGTNPNNVHYYFNGNIDVAKIYNRALTTAEVNQNYRHYKTRFNLS